MKAPTMSISLDETQAAPDRPSSWCFYSRAKAVRRSYRFIECELRFLTRLRHTHQPQRGHHPEGHMKAVVIGGTGLIGTKIVRMLRQHGHEVLAASPASGVNTITGEGLTEALAGAQVVVDVSNSPSFEDKAVMEFFETSGRNLLAAEAAAGVGHHVALSVVGSERLLASGYF